MAVESSSIGLAAITKFGWIKFASLGAALLGAAMMAIFRPPKSRKEMFLQAVVALGSSLLFGGLAVELAASYAPFIKLDTAPIWDAIQFNAAIHGLVGALSWGAFGGLAHLRDKAATDPIQAVKDVF